MTEYYTDASLAQNIPAICVTRGGKLISLKILEEFEDINNLELLAVQKALNICPKNSVIYTDSQAVIRSIKQKLNKDLISLIESKRCKVIWVNRNFNLAGKYMQKRMFRLRRYTFKCIKPRINYHALKQKKRKKIYN